MTEETDNQRQSPKPEYRQFVNPRQFKQFLDGNGILSNRDQVAEQFDYDWHARKLLFDAHVESIDIWTLFKQRGPERVNMRQW